MISPRFLLTGDPALATRYVGLAKSMAIRAFEAGVISKVWQVADGVTVRVVNSVQAGICKVFIQAGREEFAYQFYGSEGIMRKTFEDPNNAGRWLPLGNWAVVKCRLKGSEVVFTYGSRLSSLRESTDDPPKWIYNPNPYLAIQPGVEEVLYLSPTHQPDGLGVKKWQSIESPERWLVSTFAEPTPNHGVHWSSGAVTYYWQANITDQGYDFAPTVFSKKKGKPVVPETNWYRGSCLRVVESEEFGSRTFVIMVTIKHEFYCYPLSAVGDLLEIPPRKGNVPSEYVKTDITPLPSWVTEYDIGDTSPESNQDQQLMVQPVWCFSPNGDKAAAVMFHKDTPWTDATITSRRHQGGVVTDLQENYPGVVEMEFAVQITGPNLEDFTFAITNSKNLYSKDTGVGYVAVGYAATDLLNEVVYDDLLILKHRYFISDMFYPCGDFATAALYDDTPSVLISPAIAVVAEIVKIDSTVVMTWLVSYTAEFGYYQNKVGLTEAGLMDPTFASVSDKPTDDNGTRQVCFHTAINSMDLPTLTFCFGASLTMVGKTTSTGFSFSEGGLFYTYRSPFCASAAYVALYSLGVLDEERWVGHNDLKPAVKDYFTFSNTVPDFGVMTEVNINAAISSQSVVVTDSSAPSKSNDLLLLSEYRTVTADEFAFDLQTMFADITLTTGTGNGNSTQEVVFASATNLITGSNIEAQHGPNNLGAYYGSVKDAYAVWIPRVFMFFDGETYERPGLRWTEKEFVSGVVYKWHGYNADPREYILESGDSDYINYPLGIILHARFTNIATYPLNNVYANLSAEPNGSYATFFGPFAAPTSTVLTHVNLTNQLPNFSSFAVQQSFMDVIKARLLDSDGNYVESKTSHLEAMNTAYDLALTYNDYAFDFYFSGSRLLVKHQTLTPGDPGYIAVGSVYDNNYGFLPQALGYNKYGQVGGSIFFGPLAVGWNKTFQGNGVDYTQYQTMPVFEYLQMQTFPYVFETSRPTPRMEGLFSRLPFKG